MEEQVEKERTLKASADIVVGGRRFDLEAEEESVRLQEKS